MKHCPVCGQQNPAAATFCTSCGVALAPSPQASSGRPVISMRDPKIGLPFVRSAPPPDGTQPVTAPTYQPPPSSPHNLTTTNASSTYSYANSTGGPSPTKSGASPKIVALVVGVVVVVVAGIFIFANSKDSNPERAESPSAPTNPSNSDDYVDVDADVDAYALEVEYSVGTTTRITFDRTISMLALTILKISAFARLK